MESLVVALETVKKLKAAGFPQDGPLFWHLPKPGVKTVPYVCFGAQPQPGFSETRAAPNAQEIADQLPWAGWQLMTDSYGAYVVSSARTNIAPTAAPIMAEALAQLWLKLQAQS